MTDKEKYVADLIKKIASGTDGEKRIAMIISSHYRNNCNEDILIKAISDVPEVNRVNVTKLIIGELSNFPVVTKLQSFL
jgi:hypothetical protein